MRRTAGRDAPQFLWGKGGIIESYLLVLDSKDNLGLSIVSVRFLYLGRNE